jgi:hypothetical protein
MTLANLIATTAEYGLTAVLGVLLYILLRGEFVFRYPSRSRRRGG